VRKLSPAGGNQSRAGLEPFNRIGHPGTKVVCIVGKVIDNLITAKTMAEVALLLQR